MAFSPGDHVHVATFGKGIVREVRNGGRYLIEVKGRSMVVRAEQLAPLEPRKARPAAATSVPPAIPETLTRSHAPGSLDLHGMTAEGAVAALDEFVNDAILAGIDEVRVIHGRSGGILKEAVHRRLAQLPAIRFFRVDPGNPGVTIVQF